MTMSGRSLWCFGFPRLFLRWAQYQATPRHLTTPPKGGAGQQEPVFTQPARLRGSPLTTPGADAFFPLGRRMAKLMQQQKVNVCMGEVYRHHLALQNPRLDPLEGDSPRRARRPLGFAFASLGASDDPTIKTVRLRIANRSWREQSDGLAPEGFKWRFDISEWELLEATRVVGAVR
jgi:hypothetical protein